MKTILLTHDNDVTLANRQRQLRLPSEHTMKKSFLNILLLFLAITGAVALISQFTHESLGNSNFWAYRGHLGGALFLLFIAFFPRLTLLFSSVPFGGLVWWLGWLFFPRLLVACLATITYWNQNKILVVLAWLVALGGESSEKIVINKRSTHFATAHPPKKSIPKPDDVEAEFRKM
ncbi:MAG: hypothetical protein HQK50_13480 [Oligoflexia bacterium]|nr:hypothetical protein [Oligoflexia bacterium]